LTPPTNQGTTYTYYGATDTAGATPVCSVLPNTIQAGMLKTATDRPPPWVARW